MGDALGLGMKKSNVGSNKGEKRGCRRNKYKKTLRDSLLWETRPR